jgi:hypothetical protein
MRDFSWEELRTRLRTDALELYQEREKSISPEAMEHFARLMLLQFTDQFWKDHLLAMDRLRDGISLRGYGQKNPLLEYKKEGTDMFLLMSSLRDEAVVSRLLRLALQREEPLPESTKAAARELADTPVEEPAEPEAPLLVQAQTRPVAPPPPPPAPPRLPQPGPEARAIARAHGLRRNDPCPCGSGKKYKKCCYDEEADAIEAAAEAELEALARAAEQSESPAEESAGATEEIDIGGQSPVEEAMEDAAYSAPAVAEAPEIAALALESSPEDPGLPLFDQQPVDVLADVKSEEESSWEEDPTTLADAAALEPPRRPDEPERS